MLLIFAGVSDRYANYCAMCFSMILAVQLTSFSITAIANGKSGYDQDAWVSKAWNLIFDFQAISMKHHENN